MEELLQEQFRQTDPRQPSNDRRDHHESRRNKVWQRAWSSGIGTSMEGDGFLNIRCSFALHFCLAIPACAQKVIRGVAQAWGAVFGLPRPRSQNTFPSVRTKGNSRGCSSLGRGVWAPAPQKPKYVSSADKKGHRTATPESTEQHSAARLSVAPSHAAVPELASASRVSLPDVVQKHFGRVPIWKRRPALEWVHPHHPLGRGR